MADKRDEAGTKPRPTSVPVPDLPAYCKWPAGPRSVTFHLTADDFRSRPGGSGRRAAALVLWMSLLFSIVGAAAILAILIFFGSDPKAWVAAMVFLFIGGSAAQALVEGRGRRGGAVEAPFETTVALTPEHLVIRDEGIGEISRTWRSIADVRHDGHRIIFEFAEFDPITGRVDGVPRVFVPLRAFDGSVEAGAFLWSALTYFDDGLADPFPPR